jgi:hypothetical protein
VPYVRTVKTKSGATAVQIVYPSRRGSRDIEHIGSAHDDAELEALKAAARQKIAAGQGELDLGLDGGGPAGPLPITSSQMGHLLDALERGYRVLGLEDAERALVTSAARWLRPGGRLVFASMMFGRGGSARDMRLLREKVAALAARGPGGWWRITRNLTRYGLGSGTSIRLRQSSGRTR